MPMPILADLPMPTPFDQLAPTPAEHFRLYLYAAVHRVVDQLGQSFGSIDDVIAHFPFLAGYRDELRAYGLHLASEVSPTDWWCAALDSWESRTDARLPLRNLRAATGFDHAGLMLLMTVGLLEEDARFGALFEAMQGTPGQRRPSIGLLAAWWRGATDADPRVSVRRWTELGLLDVLNVDSPRLEWTLQVPAAVWDVLRGEPHERPAAGLRYRAPHALIPIERMLVSAEVRAATARLPGMLRSGAAGAVVVRGPRHNGRRTLLGGLARGIGLGTLEIEWPPTDERWRWVGPLATLLEAMPVVELELAPGESLAIRPLTAYHGPLGIALGRQGGVTGPDLDRAVVLDLPIPGPDLRRQHWVAGREALPVVALDAISEGFRLSGGNIRRAAALAQVQARLDGRDGFNPTDVQHASRVLNRQALDTLAERVSASGAWSQLSVGDQTWAELRSLESRCRQRERLGLAVGDALGAQLNAGVRALFMGPSGTGKSLAARLLATALGRDLYRLDLSAVVNKYIGETEKNLERVFSRAEELDIILLLDEGDALLTSRTSVQTSNDRYANLETNYLLQRLESFDGIVIVTTNASEHIDAAFHRRMDVVIAFPPPGPMERWTIWQTHLPARHAVAADVLDEVARRCELRGGQIRNAVLHASLLALDDGGVVTSAHLTGAVQREYRRMSAVCPLRAGGPGG